MGINSSMPYEEILSFIENNDLFALKEYLKGMNKDVIDQLCFDNYPDDPFGRTLLHHAAWTGNTITNDIIFIFKTLSKYLKKLTNFQTISYAIFF
jgi:hypothetical protein